MNDITFNCEHFIFKQINAKLTGNRCCSLTTFLYALSRRGSCLLACLCWKTCFLFPPRKNISACKTLFFQRLISMIRFSNFLQNLTTQRFFSSPYKRFIFMYINSPNSEFQWKVMSSKRQRTKKRITRDKKSDAKKMKNRRRHHTSAIWCDAMKSTAQVCKHFDVSLIYLLCFTRTTIELNYFTHIE